MLKLILLLSLIVSNAYAYQYTSPYFKKDGTYVGGHYKTNANNTKLDNFSTKGNTNPFTGKKGYKNPYPATTKIKSTPKSYRPTKAKKWR